VAGKFYEEFEVGAVFDHVTRRTITESDNILYNSMTMNMEPLHLDAVYAAATRWQRPIVNPLITLSIVIGMHVPDMTAGTTHGNLGMTDMEYPVPVYPGDTIRSRTTIAEKRESKSYPDCGIVTFLQEGINQRDEVVFSCKRAGLMLKKKKV
jgi:acyl dehydratase